jgi:hypothetical protein
MFYDEGTQHMHISVQIALPLQLNLQNNEKKIIRNNGPSTCSYS